VQRGGLALILTTPCTPPPALQQPEFWLTGVGGYDEGSTTFKAGFDSYAKYFHRTATKLNPCGTKPMMAGPGWGNVNTIDAKWVASMAKADGATCYMRELSMHVSVWVFVVLPGRLQQEASRSEVALMMIAERLSASSCCLYPSRPSTKPPTTATTPQTPPQYYPYVNNVTIDPKGLLEQGLQDFGLEKFAWLKGVAKSINVPLRISETNSL